MLPAFGDSWAVVAQVSKLLYRTFQPGRPARTIFRVGTSDLLPIGNRRYSRLKTCATSAARFHRLSGEGTLPGDRDDPFTSQCAEGGTKGTGKMNYFGNSSGGDTNFTNCHENWKRVNRRNEE